MKVKCIAPDNGMWLQSPYQYTKKHFWSKKELVYKKAMSTGDICTVHKEFWTNGKKYYQFIEWPNRGGFESTSFKPIEESFEEVKYSEIKKEIKVSQN